MLPTDNCKCCQNCEHLRIDNFCLVKGKYILSKNIIKRRECENFTSKFLPVSNKIAKEKNLNSNQMKSLLLEIDDAE